MAKRQSKLNALLKKTDQTSEASIKLGLSHNDFHFLLNIKDIQDSENLEWYIERKNIGKIRFLEDLAPHVHHNFTGNGVRQLMKRLQIQGFLEVDMPNLRLRVTDKFRDAFN